MTLRYPHPDSSSPLQAFSPHDEKLASLVEFAAAAGHEINNPLAVILGRVQLLMPGETDPARQQSLATIAGQALRIRDMIGDVMLFADPPAPQKQACSVQEIWQEVQKSVTAQLTKTATPTATNVSADCPADLRLTADRDQLSTVLAELLRNSLHPSTAASQVHFSAQLAPQSSEYALLTMTDNGRGFTAEEIEHLFDPFYSGRQAGRGLGFGLCKVWRLAHLHEARITVASHPATPSSPQQTRFEIQWPLSS